MFLISAANFMKIRSSATNGKLRFLIMGAGAIVSKMAPAWKRFHDAGVEIVAADVLSHPQGFEALPQNTRFYNCAHKSQLGELLKEAKKRPFNFAYLSTIPDLHL